MQRLCDGQPCRQREHFAQRVSSPSLVGQATPGRRDVRSRNDVFLIIVRSVKLPNHHLVNETNEQNKHNQNVQSDTVNESEKQSLTQKIESLKNDMDQKRLAIKNIKMSLEQLDVTE